MADQPAYTHTAGPWGYVSAAPRIISRTTWDTIASFDEAHRTNSDPDLLAADAHLIAAAPDLLVALRGMIDAYWRGSEDSDDAHAPSMVKDALAAIAKAEGRS